MWSGTGAFYGDDYRMAGPVGSATLIYGYNLLRLSASYSSDRYGNYTEVNPLYNSCRFVIRY